MISMLSELEQDALLEVLNLGMGQAADSLSRMVDDEIVLSIPRLFFLDRARVITQIEAHGPAPMAAVRQTFSGPFAGAAILLYPHPEGMKLVQALLKEDYTPAEIHELEQDSLTEVGNIILNACLGTLANLMETEILCDLPEFLQGSCDAILAAQNRPNHAEEIFLLLNVQFITRKQSLEGDVMLLFDSWAIAQLHRELDLLLGRFES